MRPLRVLMVAPYAEEAWGYGGIPRLAGALARGLARRGHRVSYVASDARDSRRRLDPRGSGDPVSYELRLFPNLSNAAAFRLQLFLPLGMRGHLDRVVREHDIVHVHARRNLPEALAVRAARRAGTPFVLMPNGTASASERLVGAKRIWDLLAGDPLADAARVLAVSAAEENELRRLGVAAERLARLTDPVDPADFRQRPDVGGFRLRHRLGDAPLVLYAGRLAPRKRVDTLVAAVAALDDGNVRLAIAGEDFGALAAIRAAVERAGLGARTSWLGLLTGSERFAALAAADVVSYATEREAFGLVPLEALLARTPVVISADAGAADLVRASGGGLLVPSGDANALAGALAVILGDRSGWRARAGRAAVVVEHEAGVDAVCARLEALYREVIEGGAGPLRPRT